MAEIAKANVENEQRIKISEANIVKLNKEKELLEKQLTTAKQNTEQYKTTSEKCNTQIEQIQTQLYQLKNNYNNQDIKAQTAIKEISIQKETLTAQCEILQKQFTEAKEEKQKYILQAKEYKGELDIAQLKIEQLKKINDDVQERNKKLIKTIHNSLYERQPIEQANNKFIMTTPNRVSFSNPPQENKNKSVNASESDDLTVFDSAKKKAGSPSKEESKDKKPSQVNTPKTTNLTCKHVSLVNDNYDTRNSMNEVKSKLALLQKSKQEIESKMQNFESKLKRSIMK